MLLKTGLGEFGATWTMLFVEAIVGALEEARGLESAEADALRTLNLDY